MFRSLDMVVERIFLVSDSIATHNQISSEPTLIGVSSTISSDVSIIRWDNLSGLYFYIQSLIAV